MSRLRNKQRYIASGSSTGKVCGHVEIADTFVTRFLGLLGRKGLAEDTGLWLNPSRGVHTFGMRFAIDVVALDAEMRVVGLSRNLRAWRIAATSGATRSVLELPAGQLDVSRLELGETLVLERRSEDCVQGAAQ